MLGTVVCESPSLRPRCLNEIWPPNVSLAKVVKHAVMNNMMEYGSLIVRN